jgi:phosphoribosylformylglycinamidine cyclo-ligase
MVRVPPDVERPVLVMSTDGVGTKVLVAARAGVHDTVGEDLVNHCVNDILVHGARPVAFLDYVATGRLEPDVAAALVAGVARGCRAHAMRWPWRDRRAGRLYQPALRPPADRRRADERALHGDRVAPGDALIGYASTGLHTNGYTLARRIVFDTMGLDVGDPFPETGQTVGEALLAVHKSYAAAVTPVLDRVHALAHVTGGGIPGNLVRVLPPECEALVDSGGWPWPALFRVLARVGDVGLAEMRRVFNLGIGMIAVAPPDAVDAIRRAAKPGADGSPAKPRGCRLGVVVGARRRPLT